ncbi:MAG: hypothetical protein NC305_06550 [Lachnospiraceae bacterium]|nr:hypothetical protein [Muribaculaceae bacterium]MCM1410192.1 hypothetical protein [Lachnospiraceae bacterium]
MSMNLTPDYSRFYAGTEQLKSYGSGGAGFAPKDTLVRYDLRTTDENGNKIMDPMSKEEALQAMKDISSQYGENVIVEFSGDGLDALAQSIREQTEEYQAERARKQALMEESIVHLENTHRLVIPNIQTNKQLYDSLENAPEHIVKAANGIISNYLLPHDMSGMTEVQRRDAISFGLEEARFLAENYLDDGHAQDFMAAMETIAKYGVNGTVSEGGKVTYHIEKGPLAGAPDDYVNESDILKEKAPDLYQELQELNQHIVNGEMGWGQKFIDLHRRIDQKLNSFSGTVSQGKELNYYEEAAAGYRSWKKTMDETRLSSIYKNVSYTDAASFFASLSSQGSLGKGWLAQAQARFERWLAV